MRIQLGLRALLLLSLVLFGSATAMLDEDNDEFWKRLLQDRGDGSIVPSPEPAPTSEPPASEEPQTNFPAPLFSEDPSSSEPGTPEPTPALLETPTPVPETTEGPSPESSTGPFSCDVDVRISCELGSNGDSCEGIVPPSSAECSVGEDIEAISFSYQNTDCESAVNSQGEEAACVDTASLVEDFVLVTCEGIEGEEVSLDPALVGPAQIFVVSSEGGGLPDKIVCTISDSEGATRLQEVVIDTSGTVQMDLLDSFGSLQVEGCVRGAEELSCIETLNYDIDIFNVGSEEMTVTVVDFSFGDTTISLLDLVEEDLLQPGEETSVSTEIDVNVCAGGAFNAEIAVEADPPLGDSCQADAAIGSTREPVPPGEGPTSPPAELGTLLPPPQGPVTIVPTVTPGTSEPLDPATPPVLPPLPGTIAPSGEVCSLEVDFKCVIADGNSPNAGKSCESPDIGVQPCTSRPTGTCGISHWLAKDVFHH